MTDFEQSNSQDAQLQAQAQRAEQMGLAPGGNPGVDRYRLVLRALRMPLAEHLPADFAQRVAAKIVQPEDRGSVEDFLTTLGLLGMGIAGLAYMQPVMASVLQRMHFHFPTVPVPLLVAGGIGIAVAWLLDRGVAMRKHAHAPMH